ncbi:MAG TPA: hypothetical protein VGC21_07795 [Telluria sp.]
MAIFPVLMLSGCGGEDAPAPAGHPVTEAMTDASTPQDSTPQAGLPQAGAGIGAPTPPTADPTLAVLETIRLAPTWTPLINATINATPYWPVWYGTGKPVDGVNCLVSGKYHKHALISIYSNGKRLGFPDGIGRVHAGCYHAYEMHTHDVTGIIHMEADVPKQFKLGQWFSLWKQPLSRNGVAGLAGPVRFYVIENGAITRYDGDPYQIVMTPHREVLIVTGTTMTVVPKYQWPPGV